MPLLTPVRALSIAVLLGSAASPAHAAGVPCERLSSSLGISTATVTLAQTVAAGAFTPPGRGGPGGGGVYASLPAFCRVAATLKPASRSDIRMEVWLPVNGWNGKLQVVGNGGFAGTIGFGAMASALAAGYASASTDTGHTGPAANTFVHEDVLIDFAHRAIHETTMVARRAVDRFYGEAPKFAYFAGCSTGGRQALTAAQRYPGDFDGIVAGAPATLTSKQAFGQIWISEAMAAAKPPLARDILTRLNEAVLAACDSQDGATDGVLENPLACSFDPQVLACREGSAPASCLSPSQVESVRKIYAGASNSRTGEPIFPGLERGSEIGWSPTPVSYAVDFFKFRVFKDPKWEPSALNFDAHLAQAGRRDNQILDADDPDLTRFASRGGKLIMYQGWAEPGIPPRQLVDYYGRVQKRTRNAAGSVRLFMVPGMGHCGGGSGASTFDMVAALDRWVASGQAPDVVAASRTRGGKADRTRPLCAYPSYAIYKGSGSLDDAANFACGK
jgi:feruloyl esterase